jgi:hypothetical protein
MPVRFHATGRLKADTPDDFRAVVDNKRALRDRLQELGCAHPIVRPVWDDLTIEVEFEFDVAEADAADFTTEAQERDDNFALWPPRFERANEILMALADSWLDSRLGWESTGLSVGYSAPGT